MGMVPSRGEVKRAALGTVRQLAIGAVTLAIAVAAMALCQLAAYGRVKW